MKYKTLLAAVLFLVILVGVNHPVMAQTVNVQTPSLIAAPQVLLDRLGNLLRTLQQSLLSVYGAPESGNQTATASAPSISLTSISSSVPLSSQDDTNPQIWNFGSTQTIRWTTANIPATNQIAVELTNILNQPIRTIFSSSHTNNLNDGEGSFLFDSSGSLVGEDNFYHLRLKTTVNGVDYYVYSRPAYDLNSPYRPNSGSIFVPKFGTYYLDVEQPTYGASWNAGSSQTINWRSFRIRDIMDYQAVTEPLPGNRQIGIYLIDSGNSFAHTFFAYNGSNNLNDGSATVVVPTNLPSGAYYLYLTCSSERVRCNLEPSPGRPINIVGGAPPPPAATLTVSAPADGSSWTSTNGPVIQWSSVSIPSGNQIKVELLIAAAGSVPAYAVFNTPNDGSEPGRLTGSAVPDGSYYFRLSTNVNGVIVSGNSGIFRFTNNSTPPPPSRYCGDGILDVDLGEQCDGANFGGNSCFTYGFAGGSLSCSSSCTIVTNQCVNQPSSAPQITVTSPAQGTSWSGNNEPLLQWTTANIPSTNSIRVELFPSASYSPRFLIDTPNDGSELIRLSNYGVASGSYYLRLSTPVSYGVMSIAEGWSGAFQYTYTPPPTPPVSITVTSPVEGSSLDAEHESLITWTSSGIPAGNNIRVFLMDGNIGVPAFHYFDTPNDGSEPSRLLNSSVPSGLYRFRLESFSPRAYKDSGRFQFTSQPLKVISSRPPDKAVDARDLSRSSFYSVALTFSVPPRHLVPDDFSISSSKPGRQMSIYEVHYDRNAATDIVWYVSFPSLVPGERITITHKPSNTSVCLGFLPGDVDQNGWALARDIGLLNSWVGTATGASQPLYKTDINRDGVFNAADVTRAGEILSAPDAIRSLPACPQPLAGQAGAQSQLANSFSALQMALNQLSQLLMSR